MKILLITTEYPYPPYNGVRAKTFNLIKGLHERGHVISIFSLVQSPIDSSDLMELQKYCYKINLFPMNNSIFAFIKSIVLDLCHIDVIFFRFKSLELTRAIGAMIEQETVDVIHFDLVSLSHFVKSISKNVPSIASINDSYSLWLKNRLVHINRFIAGDIIGTLYYAFVFPLAVQYEKRKYSAFQAIHVVSDTDRQFLLTLTSDLNIKTIPNGVDSSYYHPLKLEKHEKSLCFVATMNKENSVNMIWFIKQVLPLVMDKVNDAKLYIVGKDPSSELLKIAHHKHNVIVTGYVTDVRPFIDRASVIIDPTVKTCGILNHVIQAMAMGKPVVGTSSSFKAVKGAIPNKHVLIAANAKEFADKIIILLNNASLSDEIGKNALDLITTNYQWTAIITQYENMYKAAIENFQKK